MSKTALLSVKILADAKGAAQGFQEAESRLDKLESGAQKAAAGMSVASAGVVALGKQAFDAASSLQQSTGAVESIFKEQASQIEQLAASADQAVGLSKNSYQELASVMGAQLKNMGVSQEELIGTTDGLITKGADLAATFGGTTAEAVQALSSLMKGEADPIERYGISIKEANIEAELAALGLENLEGEAAKTARTQAILSLLNKQSADAVGAFGREADTAAGQQERARAAWENAKATLGEALLPIIASVAQKAGEMAKIIGEHPEKFQAAAVAILGITGGLYTFIGAIKTWRAVTDAMKVAQAALNFVMSANPIGLVVTAVAALVAGFIYAYNNCESFRKSVDDFAASAKKAFDDAVEWIKGVGDWFTKVGDDMAAKTERFTADMSQKWNDATNYVSSKWNEAGQTISAGWHGTVNTVKSAGEDAKNYLSDKWSQISTSAQNGWNKSTQAVNDFTARAREKVSDVVGWVRDRFSAIAEPIRDALLRPMYALRDGFQTLIDWAQAFINKLREVRDWLASIASNLSFGGFSGGTTAYFSAPAPSFTGVIPDTSKFYASAVPTLTAARVIPPPLRLNLPATRAASRPQINITVTGALNPHETARQIKEILAEYDAIESW